MAISTYNRSRSLADTLHSLIGQEVPPGQNFEIIVVDNNSSDDTRAVVEKIIKTNAAVPIRYVFEPKQGLSNARNRAIEEASGDIIVFTDDDVVAEPKWLLGISEAFADPRVECVGGKILPLWSVPLPDCFRDPAILKRVLMALSMLDYGPELVVATKKNGCLPYGANIAFRKSTLARVGLFRTELGVKGKKRYFGEETELVLRIIELGGTVVYTPRAVVYHKVESERVSMRFLRQRTYQGGYSIPMMFPSAHKRVPVWLVAECLKNGIGAVVFYLVGHRVRAIQSEFQFWGQLGLISGTVQVRCQA
ncbi:MAG: glycosyltransferase [Candidatus Omnitrophica bacterium]|nr:glycosyltransferase [Candidatus Omnitrophota bacterium]